MARSRNIKPGFFVNELLAEMEPLTRILFIGLWTIADKEGRLEDRPKRIKVSCLPYDQVNVEVCLDQLQTGGFIERYLVDNQPYIQINNWKRHQSPHHKEVKSIIPSFQGVSHAQAKQASSMVEKSDVNPPDSLNLIPDSLKVIGDDEKQEKTKKSKAFKKPTIDEIRAYCQERGNSVDPVKFYNHYESSNWFRGKTKIKNWKACVITWEGNESQGGGNRSGKKTFDDYNEGLQKNQTGNLIDG